MSTRRLSARIGNEDLSVEILTDGQVRVRSAPGTFRVTQIGEGEYVVREADAAHQWRLWVAGPPDARSVHVDGEVIELEIAAEGSRRRAARAGAESLAAPMPATVVEILVEAGQDVRAGDVLLKLEAMKMEMPLRAAGDGRVKAVRCTPGELVQPGIPLVEME